MTSDSSSCDSAVLEGVAHDLLVEMQQPNIIERARLAIKQTRTLGLNSDWDECPEKVLDFGSLIEATARVLPPGGSIETGVYRGGTSGTLILCAAANTFHISIDPFGLPSQSYAELRGEYGSWPEARRTLSRLTALGEERAVTHAHYLMSATDFIRADLLQHPACFRIVHLDGAHSKEAVVEELTYFRKKLKGPTLFILDDHDTNFPGVGEAINSSAGAELVPVLHRYYAFPNCEAPCGFSAWLHRFERSETGSRRKLGITGSTGMGITSPLQVTDSAISKERITSRELEQSNRSDDPEIPSELQRELREWELAGGKARFWWRDDDAVSDTPHLRRLLSLAKEIGTVVGLAVIPERADAALVKLVATTPCCVWQHGWRHLWQLEQGDHQYSQGEFGEGRDLESMMAEAHKGRLALDRIFGETGWQRVFVPPFHALSVAFKMLLPSLGYSGLSAGVPLTPPIDTVAEVNAEIDVMNWHERKFLGSGAVTKMLVEQLVSRRHGQRSADAPIGLLTHHLALDEEAWRFVAKLFRFLKSHSAAEFVPADLLFEQPNANLPGPSSCANADGTEKVRLDEVTVVVTSCGRQDLLEMTLDSFLHYNTFPIKEFIIFEDGRRAKNHPLAEKYCRHPFRWLSSGRRVGQVAAIDMAYQAVRTELIFHCEDDWEFFAPSFIEKSLAILAGNPSILQVYIRALDDTNGHPVLDYTLMAGEIPYRLLRHHYDAGKWGTWHGFSWNPGLRRRQDYHLLGGFGSLDPEKTKESWQVESDASAFYQRHGFFAAILADNGGSGYVRHIGGGRRVPRGYLANRPVISRYTRVQGTDNPESVGAMRDYYARLLMDRLAAQPRFGCITQICGRERDPGIDESSEWQIWTQWETTPDQYRIEEQLESLVEASSSILHIGVGNSSLGRRFAPRVAMVVGTTLHDEERVFADRFGIENYLVITANKFADDMDCIAGQFDFIIDNNPSSYACCLWHFSRMMISYAELLKRDGGLFLTERVGLGWVLSTANNPNWSLGWDDWARLGEILRMPVRKVTDFVYSMQCLPESGTTCLDLCDTLPHYRSQNRPMARSPSKQAATLFDLWTRGKIFVNQVWELFRR